VRKEGKETWVHRHGHLRKKKAPGDEVTGKKETSRLWIRAAKSAVELNPKKKLLEVERERDDLSRKEGKSRQSSFSSVRGFGEKRGEGRLPFLKFAEMGGTGRKVWGGKKRKGEPILVKKEREGIGHGNQSG